MDKRSMVAASEPVRVTRNGRRYFGKAHKEAVIAKCLVPGASLAAVALANGFNANLVRKWVRRHLARQALGKSDTRLLPVTVEPEPSTGGQASTRSVHSAQCGSMQIRVGRIELVVRGAVEHELVSVVLDTLLRSR